MGACPSSPVCPTHNQCTYTANNTPFAFACGVAYTGGQLYSITVPSIGECISACSITPHCAAITFADAFCSLQDKSSTPVLNPNASSAYTYSSSNPQDICIPDPTLPTSLPTWTQTFHESIRLNISDAAFTGLSSSTPWSIHLSRQITVTPRRSYTIKVQSKQDVVGNCVGRIFWAGEELVVVMPGTEYDDTRVMFGIGEVSEGEVGIAFECKKGGEGKNLYLEGVSVEIGWGG